MGESQQNLNTKSKTKKNKRKRIIYTAIVDEKGAIQQLHPCSVLLCNCLPFKTWVGPHHGGRKIIFSAQPKIDEQMLLYRLEE